MRKITKADETPEFLEFWDTWRPHKRQTDGRGEARTTFFQHVRAGADPQDIVDGAKWFIWRLKDKAYIPLASTWLNRCDYEDGCEEWRAYQAAQEAKREASNVTPISEAPRRKTLFMQEWERRKGVV